MRGRARVPFHILVAQELGLERMVVEWGEAPSIPEQLEKRVAKSWEEAKRASGGWFDGQVAALRGWKVRGQELLLSLCALPYRYVWYVYATAFRGKAPPPEVIPRALGVSAVVEWREHLLLMVRSSDVAEFPGRLDVFGGHIEPDVHGEWPSPQESIVRELCEEPLLERRSVRLRSVLGLVEVARTRKPELVFAAEIEPGAWQDAPPKGDAEVAKVVAVPINELSDYFSRHKKRLTPSAHGSLELWSRLTWPAGL